MITEEDDTLQIRCTILAGTLREASIAKGMAMRAYDARPGEATLHARNLVSLAEWDSLRSFLEATRDLAARDGFDWVPAWAQRHASQARQAGVNAWLLGHRIRSVA